MFNWIKDIFVKAFRIVKTIIKEVFTSSFKIFMAMVKDFALGQIRLLASTDLSNTDKRNAAFKLIKQHAIERGTQFKDSWINLVIEILVQFLKNRGEI